MLKLTAGVLALIVATSASAAGWRSFRIDASSEEAFNESVSTFLAELPYVRQKVFERSLQDIWVERTKAAQAEGRDYTVSDYDLDGLKYKEVVTFTDPSGATADRYFDEIYATLHGRLDSQRSPLRFPPASPGVESNRYPPQIGVNPWQR